VPPLHLIFKCAVRKVRHPLTSAIVESKGTKHDSIIPFLPIFKSSSDRNGSSCQNPDEEIEPFTSEDEENYNRMLQRVRTADLEHRRAVLNGEESTSSDDEPVDNSDDGSDLSSGDELLDERTSAVRIVRRRKHKAPEETEELLFSINKHIHYELRHRLGDTESRVKWNL